MTNAIIFAVGFAMLIADTAINGQRFTAATVLAVMICAVGMLMKFED